ncbi:hypothetical protein ACE1AT_29595 [Pelatocladus sp. BLCC-F211]|uniref:hypothetical protein n=1 Tax=Pelatocladus sp. BLCC-F211 TaxID=3342752 RepID=UPI0035BA4E1B
MDKKTRQTSRNPKFIACGEKRFHDFEQFVIGSSDAIAFSLPLVLLAFLLFSLLHQASTKFGNFCKMSNR